MEILAGVITFFICLMAEASIGVRWNMPGIGTLLAVCILGTFILWAVRHPKQK